MINLFLEPFPGRACVSPLAIIPALTEFVSAQPIAYTVLVLALVSIAGLALGSIKYHGIGLGISGVLFAGILIGHFHVSIDPALLAFIREFGLILFVYTIGAQVGPGFFTSLRKQGLPLNALAVVVVLLGATIALVIGWLAKLDIAVTAGLFAGATTNTPALGAAQDALRTLHVASTERLGLPGIGYAVAYPFGIVGIITAMLALRSILRINIDREGESFRKSQANGAEAIERLCIKVENENLEGLPVVQIPLLREGHLVVSRIRPNGQSHVMNAHADSIIHAGDTLLAVGPRRWLDEFVLVAGAKSGENLLRTEQGVTSRRVIVTASPVLGKSLQALALDHRYGVTVTRIGRAGVELTARPELHLQFGDTVQLVGHPEELDAATKVLGNSSKALGLTNFIPVFIGLALGVLAGTYPFQVPGIPSPVRLGLAGGPLIVSILLSSVGRIGKVVWYMPPTANAALREFSIILFLACVGLKAGEHFFEVLLRGDGLLWMAFGAVITLVPLLTAGLLGRFWLKTNYMNICGLLAGSMTDPPALAFANTIARCDAPNVAYATVYPLTMLLRIVIVQLIVLLFAK